MLLRTGEPADADLLWRILREPEVASRWGSFERHEVVEQFVGAETALTIVVDEEVVGAIQWEEEEDPMYRQAGLDIFVSASRHRRGIGSDAIRTVIRHLIERGHHRFTIDPAVDNVAAIRAYEQVGFRTVGVMRAYERGADGTFHDGLFMELLADELI